MASGVKRKAAEAPIFSCPTIMKKRVGTLEVFGDGIAWTEAPDVGAAPAIGAVFVPFERIKSQAVNAATSAKVLLRVNLAERLPDGTDALTFNFPGGPEEAAEARDALKEVIGGALKRAVAQPQLSAGPLPTAEDLTLRRALLEGDRDLKRLHRELVVEGAVAEEDFWELRQDLLADFRLQRNQRKGIAHGAAAEAPVKASGRSSKVSLTPEAIQKIFAQNPAVYRAYQENVPDKVSEKDFWTRYLAEQMRDDGPLAKSHDALFDSTLPADDGDRPLPRPSMPFIDLEATAEDNVKDYQYGNKPDPTMVPGANESRMDLLRRLNKYSSMVLDQTVSAARGAEGRKGIVEKEIVIEDLAGEDLQRGMELRVTDQARYFPSQTDSAGQPTGMTVDADDLEAFLQNATQYNPAPQQLVVDPASCLRVVEDLTRILDAGDRAGTRVHVPHDVASLHLAATEALRHFWGAFPPSTTKQRDKLLRVEKVLRNQLEQMLRASGEHNALRSDVAAIQNALNRFAQVVAT
ncbi:hypothetical protein DFJ74DRAFT_709690 [Hyaloraphidium curvatum]|nr:hypothetical protein DFJ74DRAFT_709690 [Hyaloraphidium curvatum]